MNQTDTLFTSALTDNLQKAAKLLHADFSHDLGQIQKIGGMRYMQNLLRRGLESPGFAALAQCRKLELSAEAAAVRAEFGALFEDEEVNLCFERLCEHGYYCG